jgi:uncharacterized BrkB/YihY/UPF0761 family membrane protein
LLVTVIACTDYFHWLATFYHFHRHNTAAVTGMVSAEYCLLLFHYYVFITIIHGMQLPVAIKSAKQDVALAKRAE